MRKKPSKRNDINFTTRLYILYINNVKCLSLGKAILHDMGYMQLFSEIEEYIPFIKEALVYEHNEIFESF